MPIPVESMGALLVLALIDSMSFGTLLVPVWLLMAPGRVRVPRMLAYLGAVAVTYVGIGVALMTLGHLVLDGTRDLLRSEAFLVAQFVLGAVLLVISFAMDTKAARARAAARDSTSGRMSRWRARAMGEGDAVGALVALAVAAVLIEVASMLPYLAATGIIATETQVWSTALMLLSGYCVVMILPALVLTGGRVLLRDLVRAPLGRLDGWLSKSARSTTLWVIGIAGFLLSATAADSLGWFAS